MFAYLSTDFEQKQKISASFMYRTMHTTIQSKRIASNIVRLHNADFVSILLYCVLQKQIGGCISIGLLFSWSSDCSFNNSPSSLNECNLFYCFPWKTKPIEADGHSTEKKVFISHEDHWLTE